MAKYYSEEVKEYYIKRFPDITIIPTPSKSSDKHILREMCKSIQPPPEANPFFLREKQGKHMEFIANLLKDLHCRLMNYLTQFYQTQNRTGRKLIREPLSYKIKQNVKFPDEFWSPDVAYAVYSKADV